MTVQSAATRCVFTVDTECSRNGWPWQPGQRPLGYEDGVVGRAGKAEYGVRYIMDVLEQHGLCADFFVEPFCSRKLGLAPLRDLCREIRQRGHGISLHLHPGWKSGETEPPVRWSDMMSSYDTRTQEALLREGLDLLAECGVERVSAFRAGNLGANADTYEALRRVGIPISSNYCAAWAPAIRERYRLPDSVNDAVYVDGIWEFPITSFRDFPRLRPHHLRPLQIAAASTDELHTVLEDVLEQQMQVIIVLFHSFELVERGRDGTNRPVQRHIDRFHGFCRELSARRDQIRTCRFEDLERSGFHGLERPDRAQTDVFPESTDWAGANRWVVHAFARFVSFPNPRVTARAFDLRA
jgi:hypothetical protein